MRMAEHKTKNVKIRMKKKSNCQGINKTFMLILVGMLTRTAFLP
jgi:hypothetical protein